MKASEIKPCKLCGKGVMHTGLPLFYKVISQRMGIDITEVQRTSGMEQMMGGAVAIARQFYDGEIANPIGEPETSVVCEQCAMEPNLLARLNEGE